MSTTAVTIPQAPECPELEGQFYATYNATATKCQVGIMALKYSSGDH